MQCNAGQGRAGHSTEAFNQPLVLSPEEEVHKSSAEEACTNPEGGAHMHLLAVAYTMNRLTMPGSAVTVQHCSPPTRSASSALAA